SSCCGLGRGARLPRLWLARSAGPPRLLPPHIGRPPMAGAPLRLLCLAAACGTAARALEAPSSLEVLGRLKAFRAAGVSVFQTASEQLGTAGATREAERVSKWMLVLPPSQNWLSVLGVNKGLTGLAKDFVINYLGRSAYHDKNGKLIDNIKSVSTAFPRSNNVDDYAIKAIQSAVLKVCREGKNLFSDDGSLHLMLSELEDVLLLFLLPLSPSCLLLPAGLLPTPFSILPSPLPSSFRSFYFPRPSEWSFPPVPLLSSRTLSRIPPSCRTSRPP
ncbi:unnamed protein product, partial [Prorocentrum cordatum]